MPHIAAIYDPTIVGPEHLPLSEYQRTLLMAAVTRFEQDIRKACAEDQGNPDGAEGTIGNTVQRELRELKGLI